LEELRPHIDNLHFRAFRAVDDRAACMKFIEGHTHVLEIFGITQITSAKIDWVLNPNVYVILVSAEEGGKALAGCRVHIADGKTPLPIESAVGAMDERIYTMVSERIANGTGEFCGLWNSWEIAGLGIGSVFLGRISIAISTLLNLTTLFGLCAPATYRNSIRGGFRVINEIGINGKFYYPEEKLTATALLIEDTIGLGATHPDEIPNIMQLREKHQQTIEFIGSNGLPIHLHINLEL
jgi:hypothetical protein